MKNKKTLKLHFYRKKAFLWMVGVLVGVVLSILVAFRISPWPGALVIRAAFDGGTQKILLSLEKHTTTVPITVINNQSYRALDSDANLDVYFPSAISNTTMLPVIVWTHGGAWLSGDKKDAAPYFKLLAAQGFTVIALNYSLAPGHTYPTPIYQLNTAYSYIQANTARFHVNKDKFILAGDSAGAQLSNQMAPLITNPAYATEMDITPNMRPTQLHGVILDCGIYQMSGLIEPNPTLPKIVGWGNDISLWAYAGTRNFTSPVIRQMSAYYHVTSAFPSTFITGGNADPLTEKQSMPFADELASLHVNVTRLFYTDVHQPALPHEYQFNLDTIDGQNALQATLAFAREQTQ